MKRFAIPPNTYFIIIIGLLFCLLCACSDGNNDGCNSETEQIELPKARAKWTYIEYMAGDEAVAPFGAFDIMKLQTLGSTDDVNVVVQYDRAVPNTKYWNKAYGNWNDPRRFYIEKKSGVTSSGDFSVQQQDAMDYFQYRLDPKTDDYSELAGIVEAGVQEDLDIFALDQLLKNLGRTMPDGFEASGLQQKSIQIIPEIDTGDPANLVDFVTWAIKNFPAERYILSLFGHGTGWIGYGFDYSAGSFNHSNYDMLNMPELNQAMDEILQETGIGKFDLFIWHACLMGQLEVMGATMPFADYAIVSEEDLDRSGWDYTAMLTQINENPEISSFELSKNLVNATYGYLSQPEHYVSNAAVYMVDLAETQDALDAVDNFVQNVSVESMQDLKNIALSRQGTPMFNNGDIGTSSVDLIRFMELLSSKSEDPTRSAANNVIDNVKRMIVPGVGGHNEDNLYANGMAIYFPQNRQAFDVVFPGVGTFSEQYPLQVPYLNWSRFLEKYFDKIDEIMAGSKPLITMRLDDCCSDRPYSYQNPPPAVLTTSGEGLVNVQFSVFFEKDASTYIEHYTKPVRYKAYNLDKTMIDIDIPEKEMENDFLWHAWTPTLSDTQKQIPVAFVTEASTPNQTKVFGLYYPKESAIFRNVFLLVENREGGKVLSMWDETGADNYEIKTAPGDQFEPTFREPNSNGGDVITLGERLTFSDTPFAVKYQAAQKGVYKLQMSLQNLGGTKSYAELIVDIDNTDPDLDPDYLGYNGLELGASFLYPNDWNLLNISDDALGSKILRILTDPDSSAEIQVYYTAEGSLQSNTDAIKNQLQNDGVSVFFDEETLQIIKNADYASTYTADTFSWEKDGNRFTTYSIYDPITGQSYELRLIALESDTTSMEVLEKMLKTITFFERVKLN